MYVMRKARGKGAAASVPYFDPRHNATVMKVLPGEYIATAEDWILSTLLGSCVSACLRDPVAGVGGMNHFMLPDGEDSAGGECARYGSYAMEMLINDLLKLGARKDRLEAKVFGGGAVLPSLTINRVGERNAEFVLDYLGRERIPVLSQDLLDVFPRQVHYFPRSGKVMLRRLPAMDRSMVAAEETRYRTRLRQEPTMGSVELFE